MNEAARAPSDWQHLTWLRGQRRKFRIRRAMQRMLSPRRIIASSLTVFFVVAYLLNGAYILSARQPADPARLMLWLSGGMVIYGIYYCVRCAFSERADSLELTPAENLWLGGAPVRRSALAVSYVAGLVPPALMKTLLLAVVLARDVNHVELMVAGVLISLVLLEIVRTAIARWSAGLTSEHRRRFQIATSLVAASAALLAIASIFAVTPVRSATWVYILNAFHALGEVAACDAIQWLSVPWIAPAHLAVSEQYSWTTAIQLIVSISLVPLATWMLIKVDRWSNEQIHGREVGRLESGDAKRENQDAESNWVKLSEAREHWIYSSTPDLLRDTLSIAGRHWVSVKRYRWMILGNFTIPVFLCLSPLVTGQEFEQWLYVVGGVGLCTMLLAPPALKIDFRRDLRRMLLVRSLPVPAASMVLGTLLAPVLITWVFQWVTIAFGAWATAVGLKQVILWTGMMNALAVFTFASENALFLAYPHHEKAEGIGMMIRAKLTFLGKGTVLAAALGMLLLWATVCKTLPEPLTQIVFVTGAIAGTWLAAAVSLATTAFCWRRFDLSIDIPPE